MKNLWPEFDGSRGPRSPKTVIEKAGEGLEEKTGGVIRFYSMGTSIRDRTIHVIYSLYSRSLAYHYPFLEVSFAIDPVYPVTLVADKLKDVVVNDEESLLEALGKCFSAPSTVATVQSLMALSQS